MPLSAAVWASASLMWRDASLMSISPAVKRLKPPPVPETPTLTRTSGWTLRNSSATASLTGKTVLEPSISIVPLREVAAWDCVAGAGWDCDAGAAGVEPPQARAAIVATSASRPMSGFAPILLVLLAPVLPGKTLRLGIMLEFYLLSVSCRMMPTNSPPRWVCAMSSRDCEYDTGGM